MLKHNISRIVVVRNDTPLAVITEKGIASYLYKEIGESLDEIRTQDTPIYECAGIMIDNKISSLIIPNHEMSIFTKSDLVKMYAENYKQKVTLEKKNISCTPSKASLERDYD